MKRSALPVDVCLVVLPNASIDFPMLGVPVLASAVKARGLKVAVFHGNLDFAARIGRENYDKIRVVRVGDMLVDRLFVRHAYPKNAWRSLGECKPLPERTQALFDLAAPAIGPFLRALARRILARKPKIIGISTSLHQTMAAIALARILKRRAPAVRVVLGGANCAHPMGAALLKVFPWIDHVFSGEADVSFSDFCDRVVRRGDRSTPQLVRSEPIEDLGMVFPPDYTDFFATLRAHVARGRLPEGLPRFLLLEASRGCWWGQKSHCTFCGLNGESAGFREKSTERLLGEIRAMIDTWGMRPIHFADNVMPVSLLREALPTIATWPKRPDLFFEVKANLRKEQIATMARGGVYNIQPGIESLSSRVLKIMRKGVSGMQNLMLLRECRSWGISVEWNLLMGFPGEEPADYEPTVALIPKIVHLMMPSGIFPISITRYSPYFDQHRVFGIPKIEPSENYFGLYPRDAPVADIAYHFRGCYTTAFLEDKALVHALRKGIAEWKLRWVLDAKPPALEVIDTGADELTVNDTRGAKPTAHTISRMADSALQYFEQARPLAGNPPEQQAEVGGLRARDLLIEHEDALLSVVTRDRCNTGRRRGGCGREVER